MTEWASYDVDGKLVPPSSKLAALQSQRGRSIPASLLRLGMPVWLALNTGTCTPSIGPTCARPSGHSPRCRPGLRNLLQEQRAGSRRPRLFRCSPDRHRNHGPADFGLKSGGHFRRLAWAGNRLTAFHKCPHMVASELCDPSHRVLFVRAICRKVPKVRNAGDEAFALAIEDCPVPDPGHASLPLFQPKAARRPPRGEQCIPAKGCIPEQAPESKSDSLERFGGSGVTHLPAEGKIDSTGRKTALSGDLVWGRRN
jgi:hypothetical protein